MPLDFKSDAVYICDYAGITFLVFPCFGLLWSGRKISQNLNKSGNTCARAWASSSGNLRPLGRGGCQKKKEHQTSNSSPSTPYWTIETLLHLFLNTF